MTEEQIEIKSREYAEGRGHAHYNFLFEEHAGSPAYFARLCYADGLKDGATENGIQWHDLRNNRLYLPHRNCTVLVFTDWNGYELKQFSTQTRLFGELTFRDVIAWCEIPKFEV